FAAGRYSVRWPQASLADTGHPDGRRRRAEPQGTRAAAADDRLRWSPLPPFYSVVVRWIAINRVDVLCRVAAQALRGVFDDYRRPLDSKVSGAAFFCWAAPGEVSFGDILSHLVHFRLRNSFVHDAGPFAGEIQQHLALLIGQVRAFDSFRLNRLPIATGPEYKVAHLKAKDGLFALRLVKRTKQGERLVSLATQGPHRFAFEFVNRRLRAGVAGRERAFLAGKSDVEAEMVPAELNYPGLGGGRLAEKRDIIFIAPKNRLAARFFQHLVALDDLQNLFVALRTQRRGQHRQHGVGLRLGKVAHAQALPFEDCCRKIRPALALRVVFKIEDDLAPLGIIKRGEEVFRRSDDTGGRRTCCRVRLGKALQPGAEQHD